MKPRCIWIAVGGSGGHLFPAQVCAKDLKALYPDTKIIFIGEGLKKNPFFDAVSFFYFDVSSATISLKTWWKIPAALIKILKGIKHSRKLIKFDRPDLLIGFGSFHSLPPLGAALLQRVPYVLFEPNAIMGRVNRLFAKKAKKLFCSLAKPSSKAENVKMPLNASCLEKIPKELARSFYGLHHQEPVILIFGGSQGALTMNLLAMEALKELKKQSGSFQVLHLIGANTDLESFQKQYKDVGIKACVKVFEKNMQWAYSAADIAIARSGASAALELFEHGIPSIFIPYPFVEEDHQTKNAEVLKEHFGFGDIVHQNLEAKIHLIKKLEMLLSKIPKISCDKNMSKKTLAEAVAELTI